MQARRHREMVKGQCKYQPAAHHGVWTCRTLRGAGAPLIIPKTQKLHAPKKAVRTSTSVQTRPLDTTEPVRQLVISEGLPGGSLVILEDLWAEITLGRF